MKKKIFLMLALALMLTCLFAIGASAETPAKYIEFGARFPGSADYITVYTENAEDSSNPKIDFANKKFYSDVGFNQEVDMSTATGIDFSVAKTYVNGAEGNAPTRMVKPSSPFVNCVEVKWFLAGMPTVSYSGEFFKGWSGLKYFDFGNATAINNNTFEGCGFEELVIPATITKLASRSFANNANLKSVVFEGATELAGNACAFADCTALESVVLGNVSYIGKGTFSGCTALKSIDIPSSVTSIGESAFYGCTALESIDIPSSVTEIKGSAFYGCSNLSSVTMREGITKMGNYAFYKIGAASLHIPASVQSLGYQFAEESGIVSLTFAKNSQLTFIDHRAFMNCKSLGGTVILPDGLEEIDYGLFSGCTKLKAVKMPDSVTTLSGNASLFSGCSSLEYVQLSNSITSICKAMFENCSSLKAISLPESLQTIDYKALRNCTSLQAVYLPSGLTNLGGVNSSASDWGVFFQSTKVYFVQEPFNVFDGDELVENFVMPSKPQVYYMPSGLVSVGNSEFQNCNNLNDVIVFPEGVTTLDGCNQGAFFGAGKGRTSTMTLVFLGDMTSIRIRQNDDSYANIHYVFANPNDVDLNSLTLTIGSANNKYLVNSYMYFCAGNVVYDLTTFKAANSTVYTVLETDFTKTVNTAETQPHLADPKKTATVDATCVDNKALVTYCFCGDECGREEVENTALGHSHTIYLGIAYENYMAEGCKEYKCDRCDDVNGEQKVAALFTWKGYSYSTFADANGTFSVAQSYYVNKTAIEAYKADTGASFVFGVLATGNAESTVENNKTVAPVIGDANVLSHEFTSLIHDYFDIKVSGIGEGKHDTRIVFCAYVIDGGEMSYLDGGETMSELTGLSLNEVKAVNAQ